VVVYRLLEAVSDRRVRPFRQNGRDRSERAVEEAAEQKFFLQDFSLFLYEFGPLLNLLVHCVYVGDLFEQPLVYRFQFLSVVAA